MGTKHRNQMTIGSRLMACLMVVLLAMLPQLIYTCVPQMPTDEYGTRPAPPAEEEEVRTVTALPFQESAGDRAPHAPVGIKAPNSDAAAYCVFHGDVPLQPPKA